MEEGHLEYITLQSKRFHFPLWIILVVPQQHQFGIEVHWPLRRFLSIDLSSLCNTNKESIKDDDDDVVRDEPDVEVNVLRPDMCCSAALFPPSELVCMCADFN